MTKEILVRNDYRQYAENTLALFGCCSFKLVSSRTRCYYQCQMDGPGAILPKNVPDQLSYEREFIENLHRINLFIALFYVPAWLKCSIGTDAPVNDLEFLQNLLMYQTRRCCCR